LANLHGLQLRARTIVEGYLAGRHHSPLRGHSTEFAEHREYSPGDDLRSVDWKVFARTDKYYVKQFEDETNLICYLVVDVSESMAYRGPDSPLSKLEYAQSLAAALAWLVLQQQDAVSLVTFDDQIRATVSPSNSPAQLKHVLQVLEDAKPVAPTRAGAVFHELAEKFAKRGIVILLSDLFDDHAKVAAGLHHLRHQRHDVAVWHLLDAAEVDFPFSRSMSFHGLEAGARIVADAPAIRAAYLTEMRGFLQSVQRTCREQAIEYCQVRTDQPFDQTLSSFLTRRMAK